MSGTQEELTAELKRQAAYKAVDSYVRSGMVIGLGTGSTSYFAVDRVGQKLASGELNNIRAVPTSERTAEQARSLGIPLTTLDQEESSAERSSSTSESSLLDVAIDGADTADLSTFGLVKGGGGALLREKVVAAAAKSFVVIADGSKVSNGLGAAFALPVEIIQYAHEHIRGQVERQPSVRGCEARLRSKGDGGDPYVTDNGNFIVDLHFTNPISDPELAAKEISGVVGVVEHGLFLGMATTIILAKEGGVEVLSRPTPSST